MLPLWQRQLAATSPTYSQLLQHKQRFSAQRPAGPAPDWDPQAPQGCWVWPHHSEYVGTGGRYWSYQSSLCHAQRPPIAPAQISAGSDAPPGHQATTAGTSRGGVSKIADTSKTSGAEGGAPWQLCSSCNSARITGCTAAGYIRTGQVSWGPVLPHQVVSASSCRSLVWLGVSRQGLRGALPEVVHLLVAAAHMIQTTLSLQFTDLPRF